MKRGEAVRCIVDYDLFDYNIKDQEGCFVKLDEVSEKCLIWFPCNGEWAELKRDQFSLQNPGQVSPLYQDFIKQIKTLEYSFET